MSSPQHPDDRSWLPTAEAARRLGVSERTLRRHAAAGRYEVRRRDHKAFVGVTATELGEATGRMHAVESERLASMLERERSAVAELAGLIRELQAALVEASAAAATYRERARSLEAEVRRLSAGSRPRARRLGS